MRVLCLARHVTVIMQMLKNSEKTSYALFEDEIAPIKILRYNDVLRNVIKSLMNCKLKCLNVESSP